MYSLCKNVICLLIINLLAGMGYLVLFILLFGMIMSESSLIVDVSLTAMLIIIFARLLVLPIAYKKLEYSQKFELVAKFIQRLKHSFYLKLIVLIITLILDIIFYLILFQDMRYAFYIADILVLSFFFCYIVLFTYWFIENKIKQIRKK